MKRINKFALFILGALSFASCSDINDIESEGYRITGEQIDDATSVIPSVWRLKLQVCIAAWGQCVLHFLLIPEMMTVVIRQFVFLRI